jgi:HlyD family secretion protein
MSLERCRFGILERALPAIAIVLAACGERVEEESLATATVTRRDIVVAASAAGVVEPVKTVEVKSKASGEIIGVYVEEGEDVVAGQLLVRVDPRIPMNAVAQAEADSVVARAELDNAEAQLARSEALHASHAITDLEYESAKLARASAYARLISARRALEDAKIAFEDTEVRAASDGTILGRSVEVGTVIASASRDVSGGAVLMRMASLDTVQVRALVDETDIGMIQDGMPVTITVEAYPNRPFKGAVLRIGAEALVQQNVTMFPVLVRIANEEGLLRPGMNAEVEVHIGEVEQALAIPNAALRTRQELATAAEQLGLSMDVVEQQLSSDGEAAEDGYGGDGPGGGGREGQGGRFRGSSDGARDQSLFGGSYVVFALRDGAPRAMAVQTGLTDFDYTAVLDGLSETDTVIILPTAGLIESFQRMEERARERAGGPLGNN